MRKIFVFTLLMTLAPLTASALPVYFTFEGHTSQERMWAEYDKDDLLKCAGIYGGGRLIYHIMVDFEKNIGGNSYYTEYISGSNDKIHKAAYADNFFVDTDYVKIDLVSHAYGHESNFIMIRPSSGYGPKTHFSFIGKVPFLVHSQITTPEGLTAFYEGFVTITSVTTKPPHAPVPEPATYALLLLGILGIGGSGQIRRWRRRA